MKYTGYIFDILIKILFLDFKNIKNYQFYILEKKIDKAKSKVKFSKFDNMILIENEEEIREILGYQNSLGMSLFIRWYICMNTPTSKCAEYLLIKK